MRSQTYWQNMRFGNGANFMKLGPKISSIILTVISTVIITAESQAFMGAIKSAGELSLEAIKSLAIVGKTKGSSAIAKELAELASKVPTAQRAKFFESAYAKILVQQNRISIKQADEWVKNLASVPGFRNTLSKMAGKSDDKYIGHFFELSTANQLAKNNYKIVAIGEKYNDTIKMAATDIDIVARKGGKTFAFELKNYDPKKIGFKEVNEFEKDMKSLKVYSSEHANTSPIFLSRNVPSDPTIANVLKAYGKANNVKVLFGEPDVAVRMLELLK